MLDSARQSTALNNPVIAWTDSSTDPGTDWFQLPYGGNPANGVMFVFAPGGVISGTCAADPGNGHVVLRGCNGSNWQRWIATATDYTGYHTWTNRATHRILESQAKGAQLVTVPQPTTRTNGYQQWAFSH